MNSLSGFNSQEIRRLHPYLSALLRRIEALEEGTGIGGTKIIWGGGGGSGGGGGVNIRWGDDEDIRPTGDSNSAGTLGKVARADHQHLFKFPTTAPASTPDGSAYFDPSVSAIRVFINNTPTTRVVAGGTTADVQPTGTAQTGTSPRYSFADHSHPTALLPQSNPQTPVVGEIRFNTDNKIVRWNGTAWVPLSVETFTIDWGTTADVQPTNRQSTGSTTRVARADHSHPTAILPQSDSQTPVVGEIRYNTDDKIVRWNGSAWVPLSVETFTIDWGTNSDVRATGLRNTGNSARVARADHSHPTALLPQGDAQTPALNEIRFSTDNKVVRWNGSDWVSLSVETFTVEWGNDVEPTRLRSAGSSTRFARADHSHPTALLPQSDTQTPVEDEIRYNTENKIVRWDGSDWVPLSVETGGAETGTEDDVQPTRLRSAGTATRFARADHSHPTAILPQSNSQTPAVDEIRYNTDNKIVRWDGNDWVELSVETFTIEWGTNSDIQPTNLRSTGSSTRFARADHSHPTALLPQSNNQIPVVDEIRYTGSNQLVRWNGSAWVNFTSGLSVPADPLILPYTGDVSSPQNRQLVNHTSWDNIGDATIFYRDNSNNQYRLIFARPLVVATTSTPSGKNVWSNNANELVLKEGTGSTVGSVLWNRRKDTTNWSPVAPQLVYNADYSLPTDVGVLARSALTGTSGSRRWFLQGVQEGGSFRAPFAGIATFTASTTPAHGDLATNLQDGYGYFIRDLDRVDIVKPETDGNKYCTMLPHYIIAPPCRIFNTATDPSGHYVIDESWNGIWTIAFYTVPSITTNLVASLPIVVIPHGIRGGRIILYLQNPQPFTITTYFAVEIRQPTSTGVATSITSDYAFTIPASTTIVANFGFLEFPPSTTLAHYRSHPIAIRIIRRKGLEAQNDNKVRCLGAVIVPQRAS